MSQEKTTRPGLQLTEPLLFEISKPGRKGFSFPQWNGKDHRPPEKLLRKKPANLPEVSEPEVIRHYTRLSQWNFSIDTNFYPLGSCTMKHNPRINEEVARYTGFSHVHPLQPDETTQGCLQLMYELEHYLAEISGLDAVTLQPAAGAHGELTGILVIQAYHKSKGHGPEGHGPGGQKRTKVLIPDSAHGTNPATCAFGGYQVVQIRTGKEGLLTPQVLREYMKPDVAALMLTNPSTLGLFEKQILEITQIVHDQGGLVYGDGANMNALLGKAKPGELGIDVLHYNLHKTFTTPHGGGGPGAGPVAVRKFLEPFLPVPRIVSDGSGHYSLNFNHPQSIGRVRAFYGNFGMLVRAYTYIREMGPEGLKRVAELAVLNANYIKARLIPYYHLPFGEGTLHEVVFSDKRQKENHVATLDIAKRLIDYGFHPPTIYFPLIVFGSLMIEPTETETKATLDEFCDAMIAIAKEAQESPEKLQKAPLMTGIRRLDEAKAARELKVRYQF